MSIIGLMNAERYIFVKYRSPYSKVLKRLKVLQFDNNSSTRAYDVC